MKTLYFIGIAFFYVSAVSSVKLLGSKECTWGPSYWCTNLTAAAGCGATRHCIQTVWEHKTYPEDHDSVCQICLDMVKQARDQLESNETQEELKEVFEGSCKLIPIKVINKECCKMVDDFIPDLVDTLSSQMNPQVVCSVAGLCNNARIDKLLEEYAKTAVKKQTEISSDSCAGCHKVVDIMENKFNDMSSDDFLQSLLHICARMSSFSDACSNIIITYFSQIYNHMKTNFNPNNICLLSGQCSENFHVHKVEITPMSDVGFVPVNDDLPCDLCKQLVTHLRDILIANTTENEFRQVLEGLCRQTGNFKDQCLSIVEEYYAVIYGFLVQELNSTEVCTAMTLCPPNKIQSAIEAAPIIPLLPASTIKLASTQLPKVGLPNEESAVKVINQKAFEEQTPELMQLPIERMNGPHTDHLFSAELCTFCEYFLHYVQTALTDPKTEKSIKDVVDKACEILPSSINATCIEFVSTYGDALVAILVQEIDPATICPLIQVCPSKSSADIEVFMEAKGEPNCPLCLFAVTKLEEMVKESRTRENIRNALKTLCSHLSGQTRAECQDFVDTYTDELVEMLVDEFKPQEVCVYLKICKDDKPAPKLTDFYVGGLTNTNEIPDFTVNGKIISPKGNSPATLQDKPECAICQVIMKQLQKILKDKKTEEEVKQAIDDVCEILPKNLGKECSDFVDKYEEIVVQLIISAVEPKEICTVMKLCAAPKRIDTNDRVISPKVNSIEPQDKPECAICQLIMKQLQNILKDKKTEEEIKQAIDDICEILPKNLGKECSDFVDKYEEIVVQLIISEVDPKEICTVMNLCITPKQIDIQVGGGPVCPMCKLVMKQIEKSISGSVKPEDIKNALDTVCSILPNVEEKACDDFVSQNYQQIYYYLSIATEPEVICSLLFLCDNQYPQAIKYQINRCAVCEATILAMDRILQNPKVDHAIEHVLEKSCRALPLNHQSQCKNIIEEYGNTIFNLVEHMADTDRICKGIGICDGPSSFNRKKRANLLGAKKCTYGPSYWCASEDNAKECGSGALQHCQEKVWKAQQP